MKLYLFSGATLLLCGKDMINCVPHYEKVNDVEELCKVLMASIAIKKEIVRIFDKNRGLFRGRLGECTINQAQLKYKDNEVVPKIFMTRTVPIALRLEVEAKLEELVKIKH